MKKPLLLLTGLFCAFLCPAQDQLFKKDNTKLLVKVTEVSPEEIKYKLFNNLSGPVYVVNRSEVAVVIYENGQHEVMSTTVESPVHGRPPVRQPAGMSKADSLKYFKYQSSLSINFFNFINSEVGFIYQRDFLKNNFNIVVPFGIGLDKPYLTESTYFNRANGGVELNKKNFEIGFGLNYYPSLRFPVNYYVGPSFRYMQFSSRQTYTYYVPSTVPYSYSNTPYTIVKNGTLTSMCYGITNGILFRTRSRLVLNLFGTLGFKSDIMSTTITDPNTNTVVKPLATPINIYFWSGFMLGFSF